MKKIVKIVAFRGKSGNSGGDGGRGRGAIFYSPGNLWGNRGLKNGRGTRGTGSPWHP